MTDGVGVTNVSPSYIGSKYFGRRTPEFSYNYEIGLDAIKAIIGTSGYCYQDMQ